MKANKHETSDIVISSRVRLARNLADYPFPGRLGKEKANELCSNISGLLSSNGYKITRLDNCSEREAAALVERHVISPEFAASKIPRALASSEDGHVNIMINEEDHLRIQAMDLGLCLDECLDLVMRADDTLEENVRYAFNENYGYLTHCPTNLGTALRASAMLHLPALSASGEIRALIAAVSKLGFTVRGFYGEGTEPKGFIYQISNQLTLGLSERETIERLEKAVLNIIEKERALRQREQKRDSEGFADSAHRALGILATARRISSDEAMSLLSDLRIGVSCGEIHKIDYETINKLLWSIQPNSIAADAKGQGSRERDHTRAELLRKAVKEAMSYEI